MRLPLVLPALAATLALGACTLTEAPPSAPASINRGAGAPALSRATSANGFEVITLRLRSDIGGGSSMFGVFHAVLGTSLPPNPCVASALPAVQSVALCAEIHNPGGETLTGGTLELTLPAVQEPYEFPIVVNYPSRPCVSYLVRGAVPVGMDIPAGTSIAATFTTSTGSIHTIPPGRPLPSDFGGVTGAGANAGPVGGNGTNGAACTITVGGVTAG